MNRFDIHSIKKVTVLVYIFLMLSCLLSAQDNISQEPDLNSVIFPGPDPFSLDSRSAIDCINMLRRNPFIEIKNDSNKSSIVKVQTVWSFFLGLDENYPVGHQLRYDIIVNGNALDWNNCFIEYGGEMLNLRLLFLYRNQYPPEGLEYRNNP